jgi:hypothetical protein
LIMKNSLVTAMEFSRCTRIGSARREPARPVSQNSTAFVEVDVVLGELGNRTAGGSTPRRASRRRCHRDWPSAYRM